MRIELHEDSIFDLQTSIFNSLRGGMNEDRINKLRHDISNPLSALLAETQLLLLNESQLDAETVASLREIEALAVRMRSILREN